MVAFPFNEDLLQFIWEAQLFDHRALTTTEGAPLDVIKAGRLHGDSGPDLLDARVRINDQLWAGNIEVHIKSSEWYAHGHETDAAYDNVVLHAVYEHDMEVRTASGSRVPTVELKSRIKPESIEAYQRLMHAKAWVPCASQFDHVDKDRAKLWLERVMIERLERKSVEVTELFKRLNNDPAETFYHMLLRGFGFKVNAEPFAVLANVMPLKTLLKYRDDPFRTEALLFGQAGFLQVDFIDAYPRDLQREYEVLAHMHTLKPAPVTAWKFGRLRPPNFPTIRLAQLAQLIAKSDGSFSALLEHDDVASIHKQLDVEVVGYWLDHYRFDHFSTPSPKRLGRTAADLLIINTIVPYLFAMGRARGIDTYADRAMGLLEQLPPEKNMITEGWEELGLKADNAARSQALIELKNLYCGQRRCLHCVIGADLLKRTLP